MASGLVAAWVVWLDNREANQLARLELRLDYAPEHCPADRPLRVQMKNANDTPLTELRWRVAAYAPGDSVNLAENTYSTPRYRGPGQCRHTYASLLLTTGVASIDWIAEQMGHTNGNMIRQQGLASVTALLVEKSKAPITAPLQGNDAKN